MVTLRHNRMLRNSWSLPLLGAAPRAGAPRCCFSQEEAISCFDGFALPLFKGETTAEELEETVNHRHIVWDAAWGLQRYLIAPWFWKNNVSQTVHRAEQFVAGLCRSGERAASGAGTVQTPANGAVY